MKDLRTLLEASILDIEDAVNKEFDFKTLVNSKTQKEFLAIANTLKNVIEEVSPKTYKYNEFKKGKSYIFMYESIYGEDDFVISFVDKWPIRINAPIPVNDAYYEIFWLDNKVQVILDTTGSKFSSLIRDHNLFNRSYGAYEVPKEYLKDLKDLVKNAERW